MAKHEKIGNDLVKNPETGGIWETFNDTDTPKIQIGQETKTGTWETYLGTSTPKEKISDNTTKK